MNASPDRNSNESIESSGLNSSQGGDSREYETFRQNIKQVFEAQDRGEQVGDIELFQDILGKDVCRKLGLFRLPPEFCLSVIMPVFNEAATIEAMVRRVKSSRIPMEVILVDDGSTDGTREVLQGLSGEPDTRVVLHAENQGKGAAIRTGMAEARGDILIIQDADMEYDPDDYRFLLQPIIEGDADVVFGSRYSNNDREVPPLWHQWGNQFITLCASLALGRRFTDVETCYKVFRRSVIQEILPTLRENRFGIEIELTCKLARNRKLRIYERPIRYRRRSYAEGKKIGWRDGVAAMWCILKYSFGNLDSDLPS